MKNIGQITRGGLSDTCRTLGVYGCTIRKRVLHGLPLLAGAKKKSEALMSLPLQIPSIEDFVRVCIYLHALHIATVKES